MRLEILLFIFRRKKNAVAADLPPKSVIDIFCPLSNVQKEMYVKFQLGSKVDDETLFSALTKDPSGFQEPDISFSGVYFPLF